MESVTHLIEALSDASATNILALSTAVLAVVLVGRSLSRSPTAAAATPPSLGEAVPFVSNTIQFVFNNTAFMDRTRKALQKAPMVKFRLAGQQVFVLGTLKSYQSLMSSRDLNFNGIMLSIGFPKLYRMPSDEVQRFADDKSGHRSTPLPGTEGTPSEQRLWATKYHIFYDFLSRSNLVRPIVEEFGRQFSAELEKYPVGDWNTLSIKKLTHQDFTRCAITTLFGPKIFDVSPDILEAFWDFDSYARVLAYGLPEWMYPQPFRASDRFLDRIDKYIQAGLHNFDWNGPDVEAQWEPHFGTRLTRELAKWLHDSGFKPKTVAGALGTLIFGQNSNTIPIISWMLIELGRDPALLQAVREEVATALVADPITGARTLDVQKVTALPILQSLFTEILRVRVSMIIMRVVEQPMAIGGVNIPKGSLLHAYSHLAQNEEEIWGVSGHPASEFWPLRHLKEVEVRDQNGKITTKQEFSLSANPGYFFPFGGGVPQCPGRHLAKYEVFTMVGMLVDRFDMEFVRWIKDDGSPSDRPAESDQRFSGIGSMPPDRDMTVRLRRIW